VRAQAGLLPGEEAGPLGACGHARGHPETLAMKLRLPVRRDTLGKDAVAGVVLGVESVPDGLAAGLLAGVNPLIRVNGSAVRQTRVR
jgi:hypothetical protein